MGAASNRSLCSISSDCFETSTWECATDGLWSGASNRLLAIGNFYCRSTAHRLRPVNANLRSADRGIVGLCSADAEGLDDDHRFWSIIIDRQLQGQEKT